MAMKTNGLPGSAVSMNFSTDAKQTCLYIGDNSNMTIYILNRDNFRRSDVSAEAAAQPVSSTGCIR